MTTDLDHPLTVSRAEPIGLINTDLLLSEEYVLFGILISATMIHPHDQPVVFEASIGQVGRRWLLSL